MDPYSVGYRELSLLGVDFGPRTQDTAAALIAQVIARTQELPLLLTDGWKAYPAALLQVVGVVYRPRRRGKVGRKPQPRLVAPKNVYYAQVVKIRDKARHVVEVRRHVGFGRSRRFGKQLHLRQLGETMQTAFMDGEYIWLPVHTDPGLSKRMDKRIARLLTPALPESPIGKAQAPMHAKTLAENEKEAVPLPNAA